MSDHSSRKTAYLVAIGLLGLLGVVATLFVDGPARFFVNWIVWFLFILTAGLGALFVVALEHLVGSVWSVPIRRVSERLAGLVVWVVPVAIVALFALPHLFPWTGPDAVENPIVKGKLGWLNIPFFSIRLVASLILWFLCYRVLCVGSFRQDRSGGTEFTIRARRLSALVMIVFAFTLTNVAFDWISSLDPVWYSDIFGVYLFAGTFLAGLSVTSAGIAYLKRRNRLQEVRFDHLYNLGSYLFAFIVFWSYIAFAQYMLQWYANMPEEVFWYEKRIGGFWRWFLLAMAILHFVIPFLALVGRKAKGNPAVLSRVAIVVLVAHFLDLFWMVFPAMGHGVLPSWQELSFALLFLCAGLLWARRVLNRGNDLPIGDPCLGAALEFRL